MLLDFENVRIIDFPKFLDVRGNLSYVQNNAQIPFVIKRIYWIYDVPGGAIRGAHAYKENQELIISLSGSFDVIVDDGKQQKTYMLNRSYYGLLVPAGFWREMNNFSTNAFALVLSSTLYDEFDYIDKYSDFLKYVSNE